MLRAAKAAGVRVTAEVTPHHLLLTDAALAGYDPVHKVNPPLRTGDDTAAMRAALAEGVIDVVATDHAPHATQYKDTEWAAAKPGMLGLQTALSVVVRACVETGLLDWRGVARVMSERPAQIGGLADQGRPIAVGEPATFCLVDPDEIWTVRGAALASRVHEHALRGHAAAGDGGRDGAARPDHGAQRSGERPRAARMAASACADGKVADECAAGRHCWCSRTAGSSAASVTAPPGRAWARPCSARR